ncbi:MAG: multicopper oxidase domain-containing protein, partial [Rhodoglobus sp.]|nr:multicopper oxidase domain-containing protein [Rhodoglobus sp.]
MHSPETRQFGVMSRRAFVGGSVSLATLATLAACAPNPKFIDPDSAAVRAAEQVRSGTGRVVEINLRPAPGTIDLAGQTAQTWSYGTIPAPTVRMTAGDTLRATVTNGLPAETSVHWHGLALRNDMDGVPPLTQTAIAAGGEFTYDFVAPHPGTYWFHPHVGTQLDRGLYGALIVEDPRESLLYDDEWVVVLDDWLDGVTATPDGVLEELSGGMGMGMEGMVMRDGNMLMGATSTLLGGDAGDVYYPTFLVNGRPPEDPEVFESRPGNRVRIRLINAGGDTAFTVALGGHEMTITHTDGFPVVPTKATSVLVGM